MAVAENGQARRLRFCLVSGLTLYQDFLSEVAAPYFLTVGYTGFSHYANLHGYAFHPIFFGASPTEKKIGVQRCRFTLQLLRRDVCDWVLWVEGEAGSRTTTPRWNRCFNQ